MCVHVCARALLRSKFNYTGQNVEGKFWKVKWCQLLSAVAMETALLVLASPLTVISISNIMKYTNQTESQCYIEEI